MRSSTTRAVLACTAAALLAVPLSTAPAASADVGPGSGYLWQNVNIGVGGFVTDVVYNPTQPGLACLRTDIGGLYRWTAFDLPFEIGTVAVDPFDSNHVVYGTGVTLYGTDDMGALDSGGTVDFSTEAADGIEETSVTFGWIPDIVGDPNHYGRVYLGTNGRGVQTIDVSVQGQHQQGRNQDR